VFTPTLEEREWDIQLNTARTTDGFPYYWFSDRPLSTRDGFLSLQGKATEHQRQHLLRTTGLAVAPGLSAADLWSQSKGAKIAQKFLGALATKAFTTKVKQGISGETRWERSKGLGERSMHDRLVDTTLGHCRTRITDPVHAAPPPPPPARARSSAGPR